MSAILKQFAVLLGGGCFIIVLVVNLVYRVPLVMALFRSLMVFFVCSIIFAFFFRFCFEILYKFVLARLQQGAEHEQPPEQAPDSKGQKPSGASAR